MKKQIIVTLIFFISFFCVIAQSNHIHFNSLGFLPNHKKTVTISQKSDVFNILDLKGNVVFSGKTTGPYSQEDINQTVWKADFSEFTKTGDYVIEAVGVGRSNAFKIADDVFNFAAKTSMRGFYLWRCGMEVNGDFNGTHFYQDTCHLEDGFDDYIGNPNSQRDGTGGWHDAGDYGKYTVNAGITVGVLFMAWDHYQPQIEKLQLDLPDTAPGLPDFLKELKWETDWILKMQYPDGSGKVSHKLTRVNFSDFIMADKDEEKRYFTEWSSAATADFVAMMAMAARYFEPYDAAYAKKCLDAAWVSYRFLQEHPEEKRFVQGDFKTGGYQTRDNDDKLWAAAELWETTGDKTCLDDFEKRAALMDYKIEENWDWGNVSNLGMFTYALSKRKDKSPEIDTLIKNNITENADALVEKGKTDVYSRALAGTYFWGCNGTVARQTMNLQIANKMQPKKEYIETAIGIIDHIFGKNVYNRSFVTGLGINPPMHPHDRRSGADGIEAPWPGYLVGGGHKATDWIDDQESYSHNEIAINWQGALVYALMGFVD
ncbi:glycoside hydrolase family 9 protein [Confluentibacter flavum]|uniref:Endoglucanase n=1 Tax=Confluentibacter flavum TaxID=1909700 RepID=A0A2N3HPU3_9FLAO|nr:glycoside hydrolase family 9 protein [Confluentibacter flavum]PKQ46878.1 endoglucanase [Confluentibacter flavum]